jgi:hypothetical protein
VDDIFHPGIKVNAAGKCVNTVTYFHSCITIARAKETNFGNNHFQSFTFYENLFSTLLC